jgi:hypothetical protein
MKEPNTVISTTRRNVLKSVIAPAVVAIAPIAGISGLAKGAPTSTQFELAVLRLDKAKAVLARRSSVDQQWVVSDCVDNLVNLVEAAAGSHAGCVQLQDGTIITTIEDADQHEDFDRLFVFHPASVVKA